MPCAPGAGLTMRSSAGSGIACNCSQDGPRSGSPSVEPVWFAAEVEPSALVQPELVVEVKYLTWTEDNLLRQLVYEGLRKDKYPTEVRRPAPNPQSPATSLS